MHKKKIALIGGAGFIGHNLAIRLKQIGHQPHVIDGLAVNNLLSFNDASVVNKQLYRSIINQRIDLLQQHDIGLVVEDARQYNALSKQLNIIKPDTIVHLAAVSHANKSNKDPHSTFDHSLRTLENALDYSRSPVSGDVHFIYLSSSMVYGNFSAEQVSEEDSCNPIGIYGTLKYVGELIVKSYNEVFGMPYTIVRPSALYGERCVSRRVGQIFIENAVQGRDVTIHGDGTDRLDFTYIDDFVDGITKVINSSKSVGQTFNITYGQSRTFSDLANILNKHFPDININLSAKEKFTPNRGTLNIDKARELLGFSPQYSIDLGYPKYIDWYLRTWDQLNGEK